MTYAQVPTAAEITVLVTERDGVLVVQVVGDIDTATEGAVRATLLAQLDRQPAQLVVDLTEVDFFSSAGIQLLVDAAARAKRQDVALVVVTDRRAVLRPLQITSVDRVLDIHGSLPEALAALRGDEPAARPSGTPAQRDRHAC
jgi:anti-sigma B factor antagonist